MRRFGIKDWGKAAIRDFYGNHRGTHVDTLLRCTVWKLISTVKANTGCQANTRRFLDRSIAGNNNTDMQLGAAAIVILAILVVLLLLVALILLRGSGERPANKRKQKKKDRDSILREANKALAQNPKDHEALRSLADLYYAEEAWEKAMKTYGLLVSQCATNNEIDEYEVTLRYGLSALQLQNYAEAYKSLVVARSLNGETFEVNFNLGFLEYKRKNFEKALGMLRKANEAKPDHIPTQRYLAHTLYRLKKYTEAIGLLKKVLEFEPEDKESLFSLANCHYELGAADQAARIFTHLRPDPTLGPRAALMAGVIHLKTNSYDQAQMDFELGLRHENIQPEVLLELKYRLSITYTQQQKVDRALPLLQEIYDINPEYKDVQKRLTKHKELTRDQHLQTFLIAPTSDFVGLCRKVVTNFYPNSRTKITDITVHQNEYADILAEVETAKWEDVILFRFIRTSGQIGELMVRDFHSRIKDLRAGRGFCVSAGEFSSGAEQFVEARLIDLIDKEGIAHVLRKAG